jgi:hypothetical protein
MGSESGMSKTKARLDRGLYTYGNVYLVEGL